MILRLISLIFLFKVVFGETFKQIRPEKPGFYGVNVDENNNLKFVELKHRSQKKKTTASSVTAWDFRLVTESTAINKVFDQGSCGGCWSMSSSDVAGSSMFLNGKGNRTLSPQYLISCPATEIYLGHTYTQEGCDGGYPIIAFIDIKKKGLCEDACVKWKANPRGFSCPSRCDDGSSMIKYKDTFSYYDAYRQDLQFLRDLVTTSGPCVAEMDVYDDLSSYTSGVYEHKVNSTTQGHAVTVYGFGTENRMNYWLIKNSWGDTFGLRGFFKIRMGTNESGIEENFYSLYNRASDYDVPLPFQTEPGEYWNSFKPPDPEPKGISVGTVLIIVFVIIAVAAVIAIVVCLVLNRQKICSGSSGTVTPTAADAGTPPQQIPTQVQTTQAPPPDYANNYNYGNYANNYNYNNDYDNAYTSNGYCNQPPQYYPSSGEYGNKRTTFFGT